MTMNKQILYILPLMGLLSFVSCTNDEDPIPSNETGEIRFSVVDTTAVEITTKAPFGLDVNDFEVSLSRGNEPVFSGREYGDIAGETITCSASDDYVLTAESCEEAEAESANSGWGQARVYGKKSFAVVAGETTEVTVSCGLANSSVEVDFSDFITSTSTFKEYSIELYADDAPNRPLTFDKTNYKYKTAYFNVGESGERTLSYTINVSSLKPYKGTLKVGRADAWKLLIKVEGEAGDMSVSLDVAVDKTLQEENKQESINPYE